MRIMKAQGNMIIPKEQNKAPVTEPEEMGICEISDKELKIIFESSMSYKRKKIDKVHEQNEKFKFNKETEIM